MDTMKYPRTPHLPFSKSVASDDLLGSEWAFLRSALPVVVTEKLDGENTTLYRERYHARSMDSRFHPSRSWVAGLHGSISWRIPEHRRVLVENVYAEHSIRYENLSTYAFGFAVVDLLDPAGAPSLSGTPTFLSWDASLEVFEDLGITPVPTLFQGVADLKVLEGIFKSLDFERQEGLVVRTAAAFPEASFAQHVGKAVRPRHVQTTEHWTRRWRPNALA